MWATSWKPSSCWAPKASARAGSSGQAGHERRRVPRSHDQELLRQVARQMHVARAPHGRRIMAITSWRAAGPRRRLRSSVNWASQVFRRLRFGTRFRPMCQHFVCNNGKSPPKPRSNTINEG
jgi:hypothetical protein